MICCRIKFERLRATSGVFSLSLLTSPHFSLFFLSHIVFFHHFSSLSRLLLFSFLSSVIKFSLRLLFLPIFYSVFSDWTSKFNTFDELINHFALQTVCKLKANVSFTTPNPPDWKFTHLISTLIQPCRPKQNLFSSKALQNQIIHDKNENSHSCFLGDKYMLGLIPPRNCISSNWIKGHCRRRLKF